MCYLLPNHSNAHLHKLFLSHSNKISVIPAPPLITFMAAWCREEIAAWRVGLRKVRITVAKPALWTFSCLCHLLCPMATTSVPTLSTHVEPGGEATGCWCSGVRAEGTAGVAPAWWCRCVAWCSSALPSSATVAGTPTALPSRLPRFPSQGKQDTSGGGGEQSVPPAHPDTEGTNTNMPVHTDDGKHPLLFQPAEKRGSACSSRQHLRYECSSTSVPFLLLSPHPSFE